MKDGVLNGAVCCNVAVTSARVMNNAVPIDRMVLQYQRQIQQQKFNNEKYLKISIKTSSVLNDAMITDGKLQFQRTKHQRKKIISTVRTRIHKLEHGAASTYFVDQNMTATQDITGASEP